MPYTIYKGTPDQIKDFLDGALVLGPFKKKAGLPVGALTLIFTQPDAQTVTFSGSAGDYLDMDTIVAEIDVVVPNATAKLRSYNMGGPGVHNPEVDPDVLLVMQDDTNGVEITDAGTANEYFRLSTTATTTKTPVAAADIAGFSQSTTPGHYVVVVVP